MNSIISGRYDENVNNALVSSINPAMLPDIKNLCAGLYIERTYMATELNHFAFAVSAFHDNNGVSTTFRQFGNKDYLERSFGIGYGKKLGRIQIGFFVNRINVSVAGTRASAFLETGLSSIFRISDEVTACVQIFNPGFLNVRKHNIRIASYNSLGVAWKISPEVYAAIESAKQEERLPGIFFTVYYFFSEKCHAGITWSTDSHQPYLFTISKWNRIAVEAGCSYHQWLGLSPAITITYKANEKS